ncbi:MAG: flavodoxin family protein, partial [Candidatus Heimdallarchaeota archaeon]|nr:flavodoxin family protein [Candidatus Heimdallarchaeota archaeon]MCK5049395.1 flavodoxin family protein [Candidatus Heimdallarchaeota archaeon]
MQKIMIIYHSGSGSTKNVCKIVEKKVSKSHETKMIEVSQKFDYNEIMEYDKLIFAFPTYHTEPSKSISDFVEKMPVFEKTVPAFVLTTYGLYSGNSLRMLIKSLEKKNIITQNYLFIRGPA